jgi:hypothetical protein
MDEAKHHFVDLATNNLIDIADSLITKCFSTLKVEIFENISEHPDFNENIDCLGLSQVNSLMVIPIYFSSKSVEGVIALVNGKFDE